MLQVAAEFVNTAVRRRQHVEVSYDLASPTLKQGYTRHAWATQDIPVQPYPLDSARYKVMGSFTDQVWVQVALYPDRKHKSVPAAVFDLTLKPFANGDAHRWLVDSWTPAGYTGIPSGILGSDRGPLAGEQHRVQERALARVAARSDQRLHRRNRVADRARPSAVGGAATGQSRTTARTRSDRRMRGILSSYRWRRRLAWIGAGIALVVGIVVAAFALPKDSGRHYNLEPTGTEAAQTVANVVKQVRLTAAERRAVNRTLVAFVRSGVTRKDPAAAWDLVTPAMRSGVSRKQWNGGELPGAAVPGDDPRQPDVERAHVVSGRRDDRPAPAAAPRREARADRVRRRAQEGEGSAGSSTR